MTYLFEEITSELSEEKQRALDDDVELMELLLAQEEGRPTWEQLVTLRQYTINFNPAVEAEIVPAREGERQAEEVEPSQPTEAPLPGDGAKAVQPQ